MTSFEHLTRDTPQPKQTEYSPEQRRYDPIRVPAQPQEQQQAPRRTQPKAQQPAQEDIETEAQDLEKDRLIFQIQKRAKRLGFSESKLSIELHRHCRKQDLTHASTPELRAFAEWLHDLPVPGNEVGVVAGLSGGIALVMTFFRSFPTTKAAMEILLPVVLNPWLALVLIAGLYCATELLNKREFQRYLLRAVIAYLTLTALISIK